MSERLIILFIKIYFNSTTEEAYVLSNVPDKFWDMSLIFSTPTDNILENIEASYAYPFL